METTNAPATGADDARERRGRLVRETWVTYCLESGDTKPSHIAPWEELSEWDKEADRRIGDAFATAVPNQGVIEAIKAIRAFWLIDHTMMDSDTDAQFDAAWLIRRERRDAITTRHIATIDTWLAALSETT